MDISVALAITAASGSASFALALVIVSIVALRGAPPERRAEIIHALAALFRRQRPEPPANQTKGYSAPELPCR